MEVIVLFASIGIVSTIALVGLSFLKNFRPYTLSILGASACITLYAQEHAIGSERNFLKAWPMYMYIIFGVQALGVLIAIATFFIKRKNGSTATPKADLRHSNWPT